MAIIKSKHGVYKLRFRVALQLQEYFNKLEVNKSLYTTVYAEAQHRSAIIISKYNELLKVIDVLDNAQIQSIVNKYITETLEQDLVDRANNKGQGYLKTIVDEDSTPSLASAEVAGFIKSDYLERLSKGDYSTIKPTVDELLVEANIKADTGSKEYGLLCYYMLQAQVAVLDEVESRGYLQAPNNSRAIARGVLKGLSSEQLPKAHSSRPKHTLLLSEAVDKYLNGYLRKDISEGKKSTCTSVLKSVIVILGDVEVNSLDDVSLYHLQDTLGALPTMNRAPYNKMTLEEILQGDLEDIPEDKRISQRSLSDKMDYIKPFFEYCYNNGIIQYNIGAQLGVKKPETTKVSFSVAEVKQLIEVIKQGDLNRQLLIMPYLYTSLRREELYNSTVETIDGVVCFRVLTGKNKFAKRVIPLHRDLLEFYYSKGLESAEDINRSLEGAKAVLTVENLGKIFNQDIKTKVVDDPNKTLHCTRHTFATELTRLNTDERIVKALTGHSPKDTLNKVYVDSDLYTPQQLKEAIDLIVY